MNFSINTANKLLRLLSLSFLDLLSNQLSFVEFFLLSHVFFFHQVVNLFKITTLFMRWKLSLSTNILQVILVTKRLLFFLNYLWNTASFKGIQILSSLFHVIVSHFVDICNTNLRNCTFLFIFIVFLDRHTGKLWEIRNNKEIRS